MADSDKNVVKFWRNLVKEANSDLPKSVQKEKLAKFDELAKDPKFIQQLEQQEKDTPSQEKDEGHEL